MNATNVARRHYTSAESLAPVYRPSARIRIQAEIEAARTLIPRGVKVNGVLFPQDFSACRKHPSGGFLGKTVALVVSRPDIGQHIVAHLQSVIRRAQVQAGRPLRVVLREKGVSDAHEDIAREAALDEPTRENLDRAIAALEEELARGQELLDELRRQREAMERGES